jgi:hypothetical protein
VVAAYTIRTIRSSPRLYTPTSGPIEMTMPSSSITSRCAASSTDSPRSTNPPGNVHRFLPGSNARRRRSSRPCGSTGIAAATGLGL